MPQPLADERGGLTDLRRTYPQALAVVFALSHKPFAVCLYTADATAGTRHDQSDILAGHLPAVVEQESLHRCRHLAPPQRGNDDDVLITVERDVHGVDGRITARTVWIGIDGVQQLGAEGVIVSFVFQSLLGRLYFQHIGRDLPGQRMGDCLAVAGVAVVHHQRLCPDRSNRNGHQEG